MSYTHKEFLTATGTGAVNVLLDKAGQQGIYGFSISVDGTPSSENLTIKVEDSGSIDDLLYTKDMSGVTNTAEKRWAPLYPVGSSESVRIQWANSSAVGWKLKLIYEA